jgi:hypothetical protein
MYSNHRPRLCAHRLPFFTELKLKESRFAFKQDVDRKDEETKKGQGGKTMHN